MLVKGSRNISSRLVDVAKVNVRIDVVVRIALVIEHVMVVEGVLTAIVIEDGLLRRRPTWAFEELSLLVEPKFYLADVAHHGRDVGPELGELHLERVHQLLP